MENKNILPINKILHGDALLELAKFPDQSVDLLCTDPPYGYSFMNKDWDKAIASLDIWRECFRVLKPGAFGFVMSAPRQDVLVQAITRLGEPELFWGITAGSVDSMVANYTASQKRRKFDDFTPGGENTKRPDRATIVYANLIKRYFKNTRRYSQIQTFTRP